MAVPNSSSLLYFLFCSLLLFSFSLEKSFALEEKEAKQSHRLLHTHTLHLSSLFPDSTCSSSVKEANTNDNKKASLKVVHKHGPCSQLFQGKAKAPTHAQILQADQSRVSSIHSRLTGKSNNRVSADATSIPAKSGSVVGSGNYIVTVGLGTPKNYLSLIFDTGSDLTWTQCQPCAKYCYNQKETIFDPNKSNSYANISCTSATCALLTSGTSTSPGCSQSSSACTYGIQYGDQSYSVGYFSKDTLTLSPSDVIPNFLFGCGQNNRGLFGGSAGLIGLGRDKISLVEQTAQKYGRYFSYCLPKSSSSTGFLKFGNTGASSKSIKYTPLSTLSLSGSFYAIQLLGISVGGQKLSTPASVYQSSGTIIDSGTVITRLPPTAYSALSAEFKKQMSAYKSTSALSILDTCYDLSGYTTVTIPKISFLFGGGTTVDIDSTGILFASSSSQVCLAFAPNGDDSDVAIFGNVQQKGFEVVYDIGGGKIGFGTGGCS
ncbi:hypothetical protein UlMin_035829 [Ulmus minor]